MKKRIIVIAGVALIALSGLGNIALVNTHDSQWTPYILKWDRKLQHTGKRKLAKAKPITVCRSKQKNPGELLQR